MLVKRHFFRNWFPLERKKKCNTKIEYIAITFATKKKRKTRSQRKFWTFFLFIPKNAFVNYKFSGSKLETSRNSISKFSNGFQNILLIKTIRISAFVCSRDSVYTFIGMDNNGNRKRKNKNRKKRSKNQKRSPLTVFIIIMYIVQWEQQPADFGSVSSGWSNEWKSRNVWKTNCCRCLRWKVFAKWVAAIFLVNNRHSLDASKRHWVCGLDFRFSCIKNGTKWDALERGVLLFQPIWYLSKCRIIQSDGKSTRNARNSNYQFRQLFERVRKEEQRRTKKIKKKKIASDRTTHLVSGFGSVV